MFSYKNDVNNVIFDEENHRYTYEGKELRGVTYRVGKASGHSIKADATKKCSSLAVMTSYGSQVHKEVENYIKNGTEPSTESGKWVIGKLKEVHSDKAEYYSEVMVSDCKGTASKIDIVVIDGNRVFLYDIKTGNFLRDYCTQQLGLYEYLFKQSYIVPPAFTVSKCVLNTKVKRLFPIIEIYDDKYYDVLLGKTE